jgi:aminoglycoside phosphotransferase (APT) family kinase protein
MIENTIYEEILPNLKIPSLKYYGMVEEANEEFCWIFLEDAGDEIYSPHVAEQRTLAAQWLAKMHTSATHVADPDSLPDKGPDDYLYRLKSARDAILSHTVNHTLTIENLALFEAVVSQCKVLIEQWDQVEKLFEGMPQTLVHGDFGARNLRVRKSDVRMNLLPFDWGEAGWGTPATDIRRVDVTDYWLMVRGQWPWLTVNALRQVVIVGKIFRHIDAIYWEVPSLKYEWLNTPRENIRIYASRLADAIREAKLGE